MTKRRIMKAILTVVTMAVLSLTVVFTRPVGICSEEDGDDDRGVVAYSYDDGDVDFGAAICSSEDGDDDRGVVAY